MILLAEKGLSNDEIAERLDTRREIVSMWRKRFFEQRLDGLEERVRQSVISATISDSTIWRWFHEDAIKPWQYRSWIFPRDPQFAVKAGRALAYIAGIDVHRQ